MNQENPFNITKAVDYSDEEIEKFWVEFSESQPFHENVKPTSPMPMLIIGGKGSGKTHIMRHHSHKLQKIRNKDLHLAQIAEKEKYIGIYFRCGMINPIVFSSDSVDGEKWRTLFRYYFDLCLSELLLDATQEIIQSEISKETTVSKAILALFDEQIDPDDKINTLPDIIKKIQSIRKSINSEINNAALTGQDRNIRIQASPSKLVFGIPKVLKDTLACFSNTQVVYLIDEFDVLSNDQQKYINTLLREREPPSTFRIGARLYGMKTYETYNANEAIKAGAEFEKFNIDEGFRSEKASYARFVAQICIRRLNGANIKHLTPRVEMADFFEDFDLQLLQNDITQGKRKGNYETRLLTLLKQKQLEDQSAPIIKALSFPQDFLIERANYFLFYREWKSKKKSSLLEIAQDIAKHCAGYAKTKSGWHADIFQHFRQDLIDMLCRDYGKEIPYYGFQKLIAMSVGIPRLLLIMLKHIFRWSDFRGERPFQSAQKISKEAQAKGVVDASNWFLKDAAGAGDLGRQVTNSLNRIGRFLQEIKYSDIPPECSISSFALDKTNLDNKASQVLSYLENYSYIIPGEQRRDKNSNSLLDVYQINGLIGFQWELSTSIRGIIQLTRDETAAIFSDTHSEKFEHLLRQRLKKYNAPFDTAEDTLSQNLFGG